MAPERSADDQSVVAKVKTATGWATGDRDVEAEGRADAKLAEDPAAVEESRQEVREDHGDLGRPQDQV